MINLQRFLISQFIILGPSSHQEIEIQQRIEAVHHLLASSAQIRVLNKTGYLCIFGHDLFSKALPMFSSIQGWSIAYWFISKGSQLINCLRINQIGEKSTVQRKKSTPKFLRPNSCSSSQLCSLNEI